MINKKLTITLFAFLLLSGIVSYLAFSVKDEDIVRKILKEQDSFIEITSFKKLKYFNTERELKKIRLQAAELKIINGKELVFTSPLGELFKKDDLIKFKSNLGTYKNQEKLLDLKGMVTVKNLNGSTYDADFLKIDGLNNILFAKGNTHSNIINLLSNDSFDVKSESMFYDINKKVVTFNNSVEAILLRNRQYEGLISLTAQKMTLNNLKSQALFEGNVTLKRNKYYLHANKADLFLENFNKTLKYYVLYDDIKLEEELTLDDGSKIKRRAYSEKLEGYMREGKIILSGAPRVEQGSDLIQGYQITLRENVELVEVDDSQTSFKIKRKAN